MTDCLIDVGGLRLNHPFSDIPSLVHECYRGGRECRRDPRMTLLAASFMAVVVPLGNIATLHISIRWIWHTPIEFLLDEDGCTAPWAILTFYLAPYIIPLGRDSGSSHFALTFADLLSAATDRTPLYSRRATPTAGANSNFERVGV